MDTNTPHRTPLDWQSYCRKGLYLIRHNIHKRQTSMSMAVFEPAIPVSKQPHSCALHCAAMWLNFQVKTAGILDAETNCRERSADAYRTVTVGHFTWMGAAVVGRLLKLFSGKMVTRGGKFSVLVTPVQVVILLAIAVQMVVVLVKVVQVVILLVIVHSCKG